MLYRVQRYVPSAQLRIDAGIFAIVIVAAVVRIARVFVCIFITHAHSFLVHGAFTAAPKPIVFKD